MLAFAADRLNDGDLSTILLIVVIGFLLLAGYLFYLGRIAEGVIVALVAVVVGVLLL